MPTPPKNTKVRNSFKTKKKYSATYDGGDIAFFGCAIFFCLISIGIPLGFLVVVWHFIAKFW